MNFESTITLTSKTPGFEGVVFTFNKMTEGRRIKLRLALANPSARLRDLMVEATQIQPEEEVKAATLYDSVQETIDDQINPVWVRWGLKSITGLNIDGEPATAETLIESGPRELFAEIAAAIKAAVGLTEKQRGESAPPSTSNAQVEERTSATSAGLAVN